MRVLRTYLQLVLFSLPCSIKVLITGEIKHCCLDLNRPFYRTCLALPPPMPCTLNAHNVANVQQFNLLHLQDQHHHHHHHHHHPKTDSINNNTLIQPRTPPEIQFLGPSTPVTPGPSRPLLLLLLLNHSTRPYLSSGRTCFTTYRCSQKR